MGLPLTDAKRHLPILSASQIKKFAFYLPEPGCNVRGAFNYVLGEREEAGEPARLGVIYHKEEEDWLKHGKMPTSKPAQKAMRYGPKPKAEGLFVEAPISIETPSTFWRGFVDCEYPLSAIPAPLLKDVPAWVIESGAYIVHDWKFTGALRNAKSELELRQDVAAALYAAHAYEQRGVDLVVGRWVYTERSKSPGVKQVWFRMERAWVADRLAYFDAQAAELQALYATNPNPLDLERNTDQCYAFKQACPFMKRCKPQFSKKLSLKGAVGAEVQVDEFKKAMASFPGGATKPAASKPPPSRPAASKPAPSAPAERPPVERGFVNPPEAPAEAARNPEELVASQAHVASAKPAPVSDALDALDRDALKALGVKIGAVQAASKSREGGLRDTIRAFCLTNGIEVASIVDKDRRPVEVQIDENGDDVIVESKASDVATCDEPSRQDASIVPVSLASGNAVGIGSEDANVAWSKGFTAGVAEGARRERESQPASKWSVLESRGGFTLYVNCAPVAGGYTTLGALVEAARPLVKEATECDDYRLVGYGAGPAHLVAAVKYLLTEGAFSVITDLVIYTATPEGAVLVEVLQGLATQTVRA
jgi:hypothetical protein